MAARFDKKRLMREIEQDRRSNVARRLAELAVLLKAARAERRDSIERIRGQCRAAREKLRNMCGVRVERARTKGSEAVGKRRSDLHDERHLEQLQRAADRQYHGGGVLKPKGRVRDARRERQGESDDEVRQNIPAGMARVFDKVKRHIKGSERKSRTEAFLEWAEENPGEVFAIQEADAEREIRRMVREQERAERERAVGEVPF
jgi:hypothetical protein